MPTTSVHHFLRVYPAEGFFKVKHDIALSVQLFLSLCSFLKWTLPWLQSRFINRLMLLRFPTPIHSVNMLSVQVTLGCIGRIFCSPSNDSMQGVRRRRRSDAEEVHDRRECKVCVRALLIKCSHRRVSDGLQCNVKISQGDLLSLDMSLQPCDPVCV